MPASQASSHAELDFEKILTDRWHGQIPFPPETIVEDLIHLNPDVRVETATFPHGRSLERFATVDDRLPRTVFTWRLKSGSSYERQVDLQSNTYIAYTPGKHELEIIEWNPLLHRNEFKVVENYAAGRTSRLQAADRATCMACHQQGQAIFPVFPWSESADGNLFHNGANAELQARLNSEPFYRYLHRKTEPQVVPGAVGLDSDIRSSALQVYARSLCADLCKENVECKRTLIEALTQNRFTREDSEKDGFSNRLHQYLKPMDQFAFQDNDSLSDREMGTDRFAFSEAEDPLTPRSRMPAPHDAFDSYALVSAPLCFNFRDDELNDLQNNAKVVFAALRSEKMNKLLMLPGLPSTEALRAILFSSNRLAEVAKPVPSLTPAPVFNQTASIPHGLEPSALLIHYCASCHVNPSSGVPVLPLADPQKLIQYRGNAHEGRSLENLVREKIMPPALAPQPTEEERASILQFLQK